MKEVKIIAIANARDSAKQTPLSEEIRLYVGCPRYPAQIRPIKLERGDNRRSHQKGRYPVSWILVVFPVRSAEAFGPGNKPPIGILFLFTA